MKTSTSEVNSLYKKYYESYYKDLHAWRDYELTSKGFEEWYYDCIPDNKNTKILDIGCGDGKFLYFLHCKGYKKIEGLELSSQQAKEARKHLKCPIHTVDNTNSFLKKSKNTYEMITLNDVLEHIPKSDTVEFLINIFDAIKPGGAVVINVPQLFGITSLYCRYNDFTHETIFTEMSLRHVLLSAGFSELRFIEQKWPIKLTFRHLAYRCVNRLWCYLLNLIYFIETPGERYPIRFGSRLVVSASKPA